MTTERKTQHAPAQDPHDRSAAVEAEARGVQDEVGKSFAATRVAVAHSIASIESSVHEAQATVAQALKQQQAIVRALGQPGEAAEKALGSVAATIETAVKGTAEVVRTVGKMGAQSLEEAEQSVLSALDASTAGAGAPSSSKPPRSRG